MNYDDPHQVEEVLEKRIEASLEHKLHFAHALQTTADALPALGIVAAVLGVIKTMASIDQPPEILGKLIRRCPGRDVSSAVFLSYGIVGPFSNKVRTVIEEDHHFYRLIREVLVAKSVLAMRRTSVSRSVRRTTPGHQQCPSFSELEDAPQGQLSKGPRDSARWRILPGRCCADGGCFGDGRDSRGPQRLGKAEFTRLVLVRCSRASAGAWPGRGPSIC